MPPRYLGHSDNLVSTLTLTQCHPPTPLKNSGYVPELTYFTLHVQISNSGSSGYHWFHHWLPVQVGISTSQALDYSSQGNAVNKSEGYLSHFVSLVLQ